MGKRCRETEGLGWREEGDALLGGRPDIRGNDPARSFILFLLLDLFFWEMDLGVSRFSLLVCTFPARKGKERKDGGLLHCFGRSSETKRGDCEIESVMETGVREIHQ